MRTGIFDLENWREISATLSRNKTRTFLTAFGIFWGTAMLALLLGGSSGLQQKLLSNFEGFATNSAVMFTSNRTISHKGFNRGSRWSLNTADVEAVRNIHGVGAVAENTNVWSVPVTDGRTSTVCAVKGISPSFVEVTEPKIFEGRFINEIDEAESKKICLIGKQIADKIFGAESPLGKRLSINGIYYTIVGVVGQLSEVSMGGKLDESVALPLSTLRKGFNKGDDVESISLVAAPGYTPAELLPSIERILFAAHNIAPDDHNALFFFDIAEKFEMVDKMFLGVTLLALFVGLSSLIAGIIGVGNIMWVIVKERTNEIGIRRAIGARPSDIVSQILCEGMVLTFVAGMAGIVFATFVLAIAGKLVGPGFELTITKAGWIMAVFMVLGSLAGLFPAIKSMKIKPIEAINAK